MDESSQPQDTVETDHSSLSGEHPQVSPNIGDIPGSAGWLPDPSAAYRITKRVIDVLVASLGLVVMAPLLFVIALTIKLTSPGPVLFRQKRIGYRGEEFTFLKFRSMYLYNEQRIHREYVDALVSGRLGAVGEQTFRKLAHDPRVTPIGRFMRRTSLDELPQLWNVLRGDMSIVGPRPALRYEWEASLPWQRLRLSSKPGITGLWQVNGRSRTTFDEMVKQDIEYLEKPSVFLDLKIILATPFALLGDDKAF